MTQQPLSKSPWIPIGKWKEVGFEWPSEEAMRNYYRDRHENGLAGAFSRFGRSTLVNPQRFFSLIEGTPMDRPEPEHTEAAA